MFYIILILLIFIAEVIIKDYIEKHVEYCKERKILRGKLSITKQYNSGGCMNLLENRAPIIRWGSLAMLVTMIFYFLYQMTKKGQYIYKLGIAFVIGGALSNICDRLFKGKVVDYLIINVKKLKHIVFNIGDFFIFLGTFIIILRTLFHKD